MMPFISSIHPCQPCIVVRLEEAWEVQYLPACTPVQQHRRVPWLLPAMQQFP